MRKLFLNFIFIITIFYSGLSYGQWKSGVSETSVGRYGNFGYTDDYQNQTLLPMTQHFRDGHPSGDTTAICTYGFIEDTMFLGTGGQWSGFAYSETPYWYNAITWVPSDYIVCSKNWNYDWTTLSTDISYTNGSNTFNVKTWASTCWPALLLKTGSANLMLGFSDRLTRGESALTSRRKFFKAAYTGDSGPTVALGSSPVTILSTGSPMNKNWLLLWVGGNPDVRESCPVLVVFEHKPDSITYTPGSKPRIDIQRAGGVGYVSILPLYGTDVATSNTHFGGYTDTSYINAWDAAMNAQSSSQPVSSLSQNVLDTIDFWSHSLTAFPLSCIEQYEISADERSASIRNEFHYLHIADDWSTSSKFLAPLPPMLCFMKLCNYPMTTPDDLYDIDASGGLSAALTTYQGPFWFRETDTVSNINSPAFEIQYTLPVPNWGDNVPVSIEHPMFDDVKNKISTKLQSLSVYGQTFYQLQGTGNKIWRNLSAVPFATQAAQTNAETWARTTMNDFFFNVSPTGTFYRDWTDPTTGHGYRVALDLETEWCNAFALMGPCTYSSFFGNQTYINDHWDFVSRLFDFYRVIHDYPTMCYSSHFSSYRKSEIDPLSGGLDGVRAYAVLAAQLGKQDEKEKALYLMSKLALPVNCRFFYTDTASEIGNNYRQVYWNNVSDLTFLNQSTGSTIAGMSEYGFSQVKWQDNANWIWGVIFQFFPATEGLILGFDEYTHDQFRYMAVNAANTYNPWDTTNWRTPVDVSANNWPPYDLDDLISLYGILGLETPGFLLEKTTALEGVSSVYDFPRTYALAASSGVGVWPVIHDAYFIDEVSWNPDADSTFGQLTFKADATGFGNPASVKVTIHSERPVLGVLVNGSALSSGQYIYDSDYKELYITSVTVPSTICVNVQRNDYTCPSPNPINWDVTPYALSESSVKMSAGKSYDMSGLEYEFAEMSGNPGASNIRQISKDYTDSGLNPNTCYTYKVRTVDGVGNAGSYSSEKSAWTFAQRPYKPIIDIEPVKGLLRVAIDSDNPANTKFAVFNQTSSVYLNSIYRSNGNTPVWLTTEEWGTILPRGLTAGTKYYFKVKARNEAGTETAWSLTNYGTAAINNNADLDMDGDVDLSDFALFALDWQKSGSELLGDIDGNQKVNTTDMALIANNWLWRK
jgi:hypothetical protein